MIEWDAVGIVLGTAPFGEADLVATVLTEVYGPYRGLVRGGQARRHRADWELGNVLRVRWRARLSDQLGQFDGDAAAMPHSRLVGVAFELEALALLVLGSACAVARATLPERSECGEAYRALLLLLAGFAADLRADTLVPSLVRFERVLLGELGFGLDLDRCALTGVGEGLAFVSPRTGRAVTAAAAGALAGRLLPLPVFLVDEAADAGSTPGQWLAGLQLTGHFLERDAFGARHQDLPPERRRLATFVAGHTARALALDDAAPPTFG